MESINLPVNEAVFIDSLTGIDECKFVIDGLRVLPDALSRAGYRVMAMVPVLHYATEHNEQIPVLMLWVVKDGAYSLIRISKEGEKDTKFPNETRAKHDFYIVAKALSVGYCIWHWKSVPEWKKQSA